MLRLQIKDISKAVRVAIQFAMDEKTEENKIFTEKICNTCGGKKSKQDISFDIYPKQRAFIQSIPQSYSVKDEDVSHSLYPPPCCAAPVPLHCVPRPLLLLLTPFVRTGVR